MYGGECIMMWEEGRFPFIPLHDLFILYLCELYRFVLGNSVKEFILKGFCAKGHFCVFMRKRTCIALFWPTVHTDPEKAAWKLYAHALSLLLHFLVNFMHHLGGWNVRFESFLVDPCGHKYSWNDAKEDGGKKDHFGMCGQGLNAHISI